MKKLAYFLFIVGFLFLLSNKGYANFSIETDLTVVDFGLAAPNEVRENVPSQGLIITCESDQGNAWRILIRLDSPLANVQNPSSMITNDYFWWRGISTTGTGTLTAGENDFTFERLVYQAPAGEGTTPIDVELRFKLIIPPDAQSGDYTTTIVLTMVE